MSVLYFKHLGSSLSLRSFGRLSSTVSVRGLSRFGSSVSVLDFVHLGSSLSLRSFGRVGSSVSVRGLSRFGSSMSVLDFLHLGSTMSLRSFARIGDYVSITGALKVTGAITAKYNGGSVGLSTSSTGGNLHGIWSSDNVVSASDRRLKRDILPLDETIRAQMRKARPDAVAQTSADAGSESSQAVSWLLRELRPVSFTFRRGPESKFTRYGFVAQELERVLPTVVREKDDYKHVQYQDVIALLTLTAQSQQDRLDSLEREVLLEQQQRKLLQARLEKLERLIAELLDARSSPDDQRDLG
jgi:hypothetical protein